jgi:phytoene dehydrogenase-like protein
LSAPVPWVNARLNDVGTIHLGSAESIAACEHDIWKGKSPARPFVLVSQASLFDHSRAPEGQHTLWAYAHVPQGSTEDFAPAIEQQIEELAPGFGELVLDRCIASPADLESYNPNNLGGDIAGGAHTLRQLLFRPVSGRPYATPVPGLYLCSSSTPPGAGVHGMCGYWAARAALGQELR